MLNKLWLDLQNQGIVEGEIPKNTIKDPWYVTAMLAIAGLFTSIFILGIFLFSFAFIFIAFLLDGLNSFDAFIIDIIGGLLVLVGGTILYRKRNAYLETMGFSLSILGQFLIFFSLFILKSNFLGLFKYQESLGTTLGGIPIEILIFGLLEIILVVIISNFLHRVVVTFVASGVFVRIFVEFKGDSIYLINPYLYIYMLFIMFLTAWFWVNEFRYSKKIELFQAIAYGLTVFLIGTEFFNVFAYSQYRYELGNVDNIRNITDMASGIVLCYVVWQMFEKSKTPNLSFKIGALIIAILIGILSAKINGLAVAIMIVVLGFSASNLVLTGLGVISFLAFISHYYYYLEITLLEKSMYLLITGLGLLFARWLLLKKEKSFGVSNV